MSSIPQSTPVPTTFSTSSLSVSSSVVPVTHSSSSSSSVHPQHTPVSQPPPQPPPPPPSSPSSSKSSASTSSTTFVDHTDHSTKFTTRLVTRTHSTQTITSNANLSTNSSNGINREFVHNRGAIAGLIIGGLISVLFALFWLSLARRRKRNAVSNDEIDQESITDEPWGPPLEDGDVDNNEDDSAVMTQLLHHQPDVTEEGGSAELGAGSRRGSFGQQTQMTGFGQAADTMALGVLTDSEDGKVSPHSRRTPSTTPSTPGVFDARSSPEYLWTAAGLVPVPSRYEVPSPIINHDTSRQHHHPTRSSVSLSAYPYHSYSRGNGVGAPSFGGAAKRSNSVQFLTPPTSYSHKGDRSSSSSSSRSPSLRAFMGLLRRSRNSAPADIGFSSSSLSEWRQQHSPSSVVSGTTTIRAPSPLVLTPPSPSIPRSRGTIPDWNRRPSFSIGPIEDEMVSVPPPVPEVPTARSSMADDMRIGEGLLDPRLRTLVQDSTASLGDHKDYSRPISGLVHNMHASRSSLNNTNEE